MGLTLGQYWSLALIDGANNVSDMAIVKSLPGAPIQPILAAGVSVYQNFLSGPAVGGGTAVA